MKQIIIAISLLSLVSLFSCDNIKTATGPINTFTKTIAPYKAILNDIDANVNIDINSASVANSYTVHAQQEVINNLDIRVTNGELVITYKDGISVSATEPITIDLSTTNLESIKLLGSGNINTSGSFTTDKMLCSLMGSGNINLENATTRKLVLEIAGSGNITAKNCTTLEGEYAVKGSGNIEAESVTTGDLKAQITGSGDINTTVVNTIDGSITGSGDIHYKGDPKNVKSSVTGSGEIAKY